MRLITQQLITDIGSTFVIQSRLRAVSLRMGFHEIQRENMQIAASELMSNQIKFADGAGLFQIWEHAKPYPALDLFALDFGPGIKNTYRAMQDGYSTKNTLGKGLGSIRRSADFFDIYSQKKSSIPSDQDKWYGTAAWASFKPSKTKEKQDKSTKNIQTGIYLKALRDNVYNGDAIRFTNNRRFFNWIHLDGLGHGRQAAQTAESLYHLPEPDSQPKEVLSTINQRLYGSRGAMGLAVRIDMEKLEVSYAGLGDLILRRISRKDKTRFIFQDGVLGKEPNNIKTAVFKLKEGDLIYSHSDGIALKPAIEDFPDLKNHHPQLIALFLGQILGKTLDDQSLFIFHYQDNFKN